MRLRLLRAGSCVSLLIAAALLAGAAPLSLEKQRAPDFKLRTVTGEKLGLERLRAKGPIVLDFWATWCHPCAEMMPELDALHRKYRERGLTVIGVSVDGPRNFARVRPAALRLGIGYPIAIDEDGRLAQLYRVRAMPTTLLIDTAGVIVRVSEGWHPGETRGLEAAVAALLPAAPVEAPAK